MSLLTDHKPFMPHVQRTQGFPVYVLTLLMEFYKFRGAHVGLYLSEVMLIVFLINNLEIDVLNIFVTESLTPSCHCTSNGAGD